MARIFAYHSSYSPRNGPLSWSFTTSTFDTPPLGPFFKIHKPWNILYFRLLWIGYPFLSFILHLACSPITGGFRPHYSPPIPLGTSSVAYHSWAIPYKVFFFLPFHCLPTFAFIPSVFSFSVLIFHGSFLSLASIASIPRQSSFYKSSLSLLRTRLVWSSSPIPESQYNLHFLFPSFLFLPLILKIIFCYVARFPFDSASRRSVIVNLPYGQSLMTPLCVFPYYFFRNFCSSPFSFCPSLPFPFLSLVSF